jgi:hypothetical protein
MSGIGHLGEMEIMDFLQKKKSMAIYLPLTDKGIDLLAVKGSNFYQIQVKTSKFQKTSYFWFDLYGKKMVYSANTFYIFVCYTLGRRQFMSKTYNYFIVPSLHIKQWINDGILVTKKNDSDCFNVFLYPDEDSKCWEYRNKGKKIDWSPYWNNFACFD